jgi:hypothetical protein
MTKAAGNDSTLDLRRRRVIRAGRRTRDEVTDAGKSRRRNVADVIRAWAVVSALAVASCRSVPPIDRVREVVVEMSYNTPTALRNERTQEVVNLVFDGAADERLLRYLSDVARSDSVPIRGVEFAWRVIVAGSIRSNAAADIVSVSLSDPAIASDSRQMLVDEVSFVANTITNDERLHDWTRRVLDVATNRRADAEMRAAFAWALATMDRGDAAVNNRLLKMAHDETEDSLFRIACVTSLCRRVSEDPNDEFRIALVRISKEDADEAVRRAAARWLELRAQ